VARTNRTVISRIMSLSPLKDKRYLPKQLRFLPKELQGQLDFPARAGAGDPAKVCGGCRSVGSAEGHLIEGIEKLAAKLKPQLLPDGDILHQREVGAIGSGAIDDVAPNRAVHTPRQHSRRNEDGGVEKLLDRG